MSVEKSSTRRQRRAAYIAAGRCSECGKPRGSTGTSAKCRACADQHNTITRKASHRNVAQGLCPCGAEKPEHTYRCARCEEVHKIKSRELRRKRVDTGKCVRCGKPILEDTGVTKCINCMEETFGFRWN